jgi:chromosome segregation ATPase
MTETTEPVGEADPTHLDKELASVREQLQNSESALREMTRLREEAVRTTAGLETRLRALSEQLEHQRSVAANAARERDDYGMRLIQAERQAAALTEEGGAADWPALRRRLDDAAGRVSQLDEELRLMRHTVSWRVTRPLRSFRTTLSSRSGR